ncbi:MAG: hypothetical protein AAF490_18465 [Chloroflexota bacterium]
MTVFQPPKLFEQLWEPIFLILLLVALVGLGSSLYLLAPQKRGPYRPAVAWNIAGIVILGYFLISWLTGVLKTILSQPLIREGQLADPQWVAFTSGCFLVVVVGYWVIWPKGTLTHGRKLSLTAIFTFGILWGLGEGQFLMSILAIVERFNLSLLWTGFIAYFLIAAFKGAWQSLFWDIYVSPEHNIEEWNGPKVLFVHTPNMIFSLTYVLLYENVAIFVLLQIIALVGSTYFMHFPPFWSQPQES